ncbi:hypothetical protein AAKU55_002377 [Oxalobacteraceae bacterium GrIS 1.11]
MKKLICSAVALAFTSLLAFSAQAADVAGRSSATFNDPTPHTTYSGTGTNSFTWGNAAHFGTGPNNLTFTGSRFSSAFDQPFNLGTLSYFNGTTAVGSNATEVHFDSRLSFSQPSGLMTVNSDFVLGLNSTLNNGGPAHNGDYVSFAHPESTNTFTIQGVSYKVMITGFRNVVGDGFLESNANQFHVLEGHCAQADLYGTVVMAAVPEPETYGMMLAGLAALGLVARRRKNKAA